jgi:hypothetical protein
LKRRKRYCAQARFSFPSAATLKEMLQLIGMGDNLCVDDGSLPGGWDQALLLEVGGDTSKRMVTEFMVSHRIERCV